MVTRSHRTLMRQGRPAPGGGRAVPHPEGEGSPGPCDLSPAPLGLSCDDRRNNRRGDWGPIVFIGVVSGLVITRLGISFVTHFVSVLNR